eukprot:2406419-Pyramimonas_sp.AAC.1
MLGHAGHAGLTHGLTPGRVLCHRAPTRNLICVATSPGVLERAADGQPEVRRPPDARHQRLHKA